MICYYIIVSWNISSSSRGESLGLRFPVLSVSRWYVPYVGSFSFRREGGSRHVLCATVAMTAMTEREISEK